MKELIESLEALVAEENREATKVIRIYNAYFTKEREFRISLLKQSKDRDGDVGVIVFLDTLRYRINEILDRRKRECQT